MPVARPESPPSAPVKGWKEIKMSGPVSTIRNPIREVIQGINLAAPHASGKPLINLGLGDPSVFGNMPPPKEALDAIEAALRSGKADGYPQSTGYPAARQAVADYFNEEGGNFHYTADDCVLTHGTSGALEMCISVLADETKNVIFPRPLFTAYETSTYVSKAEMRYYNLLSDNNWEVDLASLEAQIDDNTAFVMLTNPGNPTGSNFSEAHLREIAALMARKKVLVISDEVYAGLAWDVSGPKQERPIVQGHFNRRAFTPYASICGDAPVLTCGGLSKRWLAPGWRLGWVLVHDPLKVMDEVREGLGRWAFRIQGPSSTMQCALPALLANTPESFYEETMATLQHTSAQLFARLSQIPGLKPILPQGAMYLVCGGLDNFEFATELEFFEGLHAEENVFILPGACFRMDGFASVRFVTTVPLPKLLEAADRMEAFCARHPKKV